jgi:hypothetical protein
MKLALQRSVKQHASRSSGLDEQPAEDGLVVMIVGIHHLLLEALEELSESFETRVPSFHVFA